MSYEPITIDPLSVYQTLNAYTPGAIDYAKLKFQEAARDTSISLLLRQDEIDRAKQGTAFGEDEWRQSEFYRPGLDYEQGMTRELAKMQADAYDKEKYSEEMSRRSSVFNEVVGFFGSVAGSALDPLNYVPFVGMLPKALKGAAATKSVTKSALRNAFEGGIGAAVMQPALGSVRQDLQLDYDAGYAAHDIAAGIGAGLVFGAAGGYIAKRLGGLEVDPKDPTNVKDAEAPPLAEFVPFSVRDVDRQIADMRQVIQDYDNNGTITQPVTSTKARGYNIRDVGRGDLMEGAFRPLIKRADVFKVQPRTVPQADLDGMIYSGRLNQFGSKVKYEVVEAGRLITSQSEKFPERLAKLSKETAEQTKQKIAEIASNPDYQALASKSLTSREGAPVITNRKEVLDGSARAEGIAAMYRNNPEAADLYRASLIDNGFLPADSKMKNPVLVRRVVEADQAYNRKGGQQMFVKHANEDFGEPRFDALTAMQDGERVSANTLGMYDDSVSLRDKSNTAFFNELAADVLAEPGQPRRVAEEGKRLKLTKEEITRVENAFYGKVFDDVNIVADIRSTPKNLVINKVDFGKIHSTASRVISGTIGDISRVLDQVTAGELAGDSFQSFLSSYHKAMREVADLRERNISLDKRMSDILEADPQMHGRVQSGNGEVLDAKTLRLMQIVNVAQKDPEVGVRYIKQAVKQIAEGSTTDEPFQVGAMLDSLAGKANAEINPGSRLTGPKAALEDPRYDPPDPLPAEDLDAPVLDENRLLTEEDQLLDAELGDLNAEEQALLDAATADVDTTEKYMAALEAVAPCTIRTS